MYTQCPHCQTIFGVSETHLSAAFGRVRCGHCRGQFNAKRHLLDSIPEEVPEQAQAATAKMVDETNVSSTPSEPAVVDTESEQSEVIPAEEMDYIDLSTSAEEPAAEDTEPDAISIEETSPPLAPETTPTNNVAPSPVKDNAQTEELDAIFAALDHRLEELSEDTTAGVIKPFETFEASDEKSGDFEDVFGDPDDQTEDDIKASIETIFAAAEAELIKTDTVDDDIVAENKIPLEVLPADTDVDIDVELLGTEDLGQEDDTPEQQLEDVFTSETDEDIEVFDLAADDAHDTGTISSDEASQDSRPAFEQEELPFALHEDLIEPPRPVRSWPKTLSLWALMLILFAGLGFQLALFRNVELAQKLPVLKPYLVTFCQFLPCQFTGQRDVKRIHLTNRDVRTHPKGKNTILISAIFMNTAHFDQPYPDILITLSDLTTTVVAQRRFSPQDYLAQQTSPFQLMRAGKPIHITLEVLDPGNDAVNFQFEFL